MSAGLTGKSHEQSYSTGLAALSARKNASPITPFTDGAVAAFERRRAEIAAEVKTGRMTPVVAKELARIAAGAMKASLAKSRADAIKPSPNIERVVEALAARKTAREAADPVAVGRETNRLLAALLTEQALASRGPSLAARATTRDAMGRGSIGLDKLLELHRESTQAGDEVAVEWGRREMTRLRGTVFGSAGEAVDHALARPGAVHPTVLRDYVSRLQVATPENRETFLAAALANQDATAVAAVCLAARELGHPLPEALVARLAEMPDAALEYVRAVEVAVYEATLSDAQALIDHAVSQMDRDAELPGLAAPTEAQLLASERARETVAGGVHVSAVNAALGLGGSPA